MIKTVNVECSYLINSFKIIFNKIKKFHINNQREIKMENRIFSSFKIYENDKDQLFLETNDKT